MNKRIMNTRKSIVMSLVYLYSAFSFATSALTPEHPDPNETPGELCNTQDADYAGNRYDAKIPYCERNVSYALKEKVYEYYKVPENVRKNYTIDHFIPLSIGGSNHEENLWPEHKGIKALRMNLELEIYEAVRDGKMSQQDAIAKIIKAKMNPPLSMKSEYYEYRD